MKEFTVQKALDILGLKPGATEEEIKSARNRLAKQYHSDISAGSQEKMSEINIAFEFLESKNFQTSSAKETWPSDGARWQKSWQEQEEDRMRDKGVPPWQTDYRASNSVGTTFADINYCKKKIYEKATELSSEKPERYTFWPWDGIYFRASFTAFCNKDAVGFAGEVMEKWSKSDGNKVIAVFYIPVAFNSNRQVYLVRLYGLNVTGKGIVETHESFNANPGNDQKFVREMRRKYPPE